MAPSFSFSKWPLLNYAVRILIHGQLLSRFRAPRPSQTGFRSCVCIHSSRTEVNLRRCQVVGLDGNRRRAPYPIFEAATFAYFLVFLLSLFSSLAPFVCLFVCLGCCFCFSYYALPLGLFSFWRLFRPFFFCQCLFLFWLFVSSFFFRRPAR